MNYVERNQEVISDDGFLQRVHETVRVGLRKCPKCGASAKSVTVNIEEIPEEYRADFIDAGDDFYMIKCSKCKHHGKYFLTLERAAEDWNDKR